MQKVLTVYRANPTFKNAMKVRAYERAHMMAVCMLSREDQALVADCIYHANQGFTRPLE